MLGSGTIGDPYIIENATDWNVVSTSETYQTAHFALNSDINFGGANLDCWFFHDGTAATRWQGTFEGNGYTLSNFNFIPKLKNGTWSAACAIHSVDTMASVKNVNFASGSATGTSSGGNAGVACILRASWGLLENINITSCTLSGNNNVAAPISSNLGTIINCHARSCTITGTNISGLLYTATTGSLTSKCSGVLNTLTGNAVAGFTVSPATGSVYEDCYTRGSTLNGTTSASGFVANVSSTNGGKIVRCYAANTLASGTSRHGFSTSGTYDNLLSTDNFWDDTLYASTARPYAQGLTTADMKSRGGLIVTLGDEYIYLINEYPKFAGQPAENPITVTYNGNGNTAGAAPASQTGESGYFVAKRNTLEKTDSIFTYWNTAANGSGTTYLANSIITSAATLYAQYQAWARSVNAYFGAVSTADGTYDYPGDKQGAVLQNVGDKVSIALRCASGKKSAAQLIIYAPVDCQVSKDDVTYSDSITFAAGEITDENKYFWTKRVSAEVNITQDIGFLTNPPLNTLGVIDI